MSAQAPFFHPANRSEWRRWLEEHHASAYGVWLVTGRTGSDLPRLAYEESVEEALCFGWIDGQAGTIDAQRRKQYFAPRQRGSPWARTNKERVARLEAAGLMTSAGRAVIDRAKADGTWSILDSVDRLELPPELESALDAKPPARANWNAWPDSVKRIALAQIVFAKRPETRAKRIARYAEMALRNERPTS